MYCTKCGGTGIILKTGEICDACESIREEDSERKGECLSIPSQYRHIKFSEGFLPNDMIESYKIYMSKLEKDITSLKMVNKNIFLSSPIKHGKTVLAYSCIQDLFRKGITVFPVFDTGEITKIIKDLDSSKKSAYLDGLELNPMALYNAQYLFVKVTDKTDYDTYDTISTLIDRRTRRGNDTVFLSNRSWSDFIENDKKGVVRALIGDGSFGTIENKSFWLK